MQQYKINPDGFKEIKKQMLIRVMPLLLIGIIFGIAIAVINSKDKSTDLDALPIVIPVITVAVGWALYRGVNRQRSLLESYQLNLTDNLVTREQLNSPSISIDFEDIKEIIKNKEGSFIIKGKDPNDLIMIPVQIERYTVLENTLAQIKPFSTTAAKSKLQQYRIVLAIFTLALMIVFFTVKSKIITMVSGIILVVLLSWGFYEIRKNKNIDARTRRGTWWILLVIASIIGNMIMKLTPV